MFNFINRSNANQSEAMSVATAIAKARDGQVVVIDVREAAEIAASGKAAGALHIPLALIPLKADPGTPDRPAELCMQKPVVVYCASGMRSGSAVAALKKLGYDAHNIGTIRDWAAAGGAISH